LIFSGTYVDNLSALIMAESETSTGISDNEPGSGSSEDEDQVGFVHILYCIDFSWQKSSQLLTATVVSTG
jgi:hypothetical protein